MYMPLSFAFGVCSTKDVFAIAYLRPWQSRRQCGEGCSPHSDGRELPGWAESCVSVRHLELGTELALSARDNTHGENTMNCI